ncbi:non-ribosomal peptide synthetase/type I polyketide synthase [Paenibacillus elgii]|uniref:non-ribosomal peptide synthetase/type I polyketide synthase n=1 Tax=Paenibacillus elgii TaxID=189691 RepID=UPI0013D7F8AE|nr:non-ribosomal peptide synthetase/type I polyketide synthase [Paenibacillus elgii]
MNDTNTSHIRDIIDRFRERGIELWAEEGKLRFRAPKGTLTPELRTELQAHKDMLLVYLLEEKGGGGLSGLPLAPIARHGEMPLSFAQQRLWFMQQMDPTNISYNVPMTVRIEGALDADILERCLNEIIRRHEALRATFPSSNGKPVQHIAESMLLKLERTDLREEPAERRERRALELAVQEARRPFDIASGPLIRSKLIRLEDEAYILALNLHHLVTDGWSMGILGSELSELYGAFSAGEASPLPDLEIQYADFAYWQRRWVETDALQAQRTYWHHKLAQLPPLELPTDHPRPARQSFKGDMETFVFPASLAEALTALSRQQGVTTFMTVLTAVNVLLARYTSQDEIVLATPVSTRGITGLEKVIGTFMNTLVMRTQVSGDPTFLELLERVRDTAVEAFDHQDFPFDKLVEEVQPERSRSHSPLFQVLFLFETVASSLIRLPGLQTSSIHIPLGTSRFDIVLLLTSTERGLEGALEYATDLFDSSTIRRMIGHLEVLLEGIVHNPQAPLSELPLLTPAEHRMLEEWNATGGAWEQEHTFPELFEAAAEATPDRTALVCKNERLTFRELNCRANRLAHRLRKHGVGRGVRVGLCVGRSIEAIVGLLGIVKAGGAYVPIDPSYPEDRIRYMLQDASPSVILTDEASAGKMDGSLAVRLYLGAGEAALAEEPEHNLESLAKPEDPVYVIYTSGSTGQPRGVVVTHRSLFHLGEALEEAIYRHHPGVGQVVVNGSLSFDTSVKQIIQLLRGRTLHIIPEEIRLDGAAFVAYLREQEIDAFDCTPSQCRLLMQFGLLERQGTRPLLGLIGGEPIEESTWQAMREAKGIEFYNLYGPTECTVDATVCRVRESELPSLGRPLRNVAIYLLDSRQKPVPLGVPGEIWIGGSGVSEGYLGHPDLTAEKFWPDRFSAAKEGARMYRTGDIGKRRADGSFAYLGRTDFQVKIRGFRIEPEEIESVLAGHPDIEQACVMVREDEAGQPALAAYVVPSAERAPMASGHTRHLLNNGLAVVQLNKNETNFLYRDIFENLAYLRHGISVDEGHVIFDVGANIGMFTLQAHMQAPGVRIFAFEPNPYVRELTILNARLYGAEATIMDCALAAEEGEAEFTFYPKFSFLSGLHTDTEEEKELVRSFIRRNEKPSQELDEAVEAILDDRLKSVQLTVPVRRLSDVIREHRVERIDLLKINVEKAELAVLQGIDAEDWPKIGQVVLELHDVNDRLQWVMELLKRHGFQVIAEKDWSLDVTQNIYYLYATREPKETVVRRWMTPLPPMNAQEVRVYAEQRLPRYMVPSHVVLLDRLPLTPHGKVDRQRLPAPEEVRAQGTAAQQLPQTAVERAVASIWKDLLGAGSVGLDDNFFDIGGHSLLLTQVHARLRNELSADIELLELFEYPTVRLLAQRLTASSKENTEEAENRAEQTAPKAVVDPSGQAVAIIGMSGRFPGASDIESFWTNLANEVESIRRFTPDMLEASGLPRELLTRQEYVPARGTVDGIEWFDAGFFGYSPREAEMLDPQQRLFLECAWEAMEKAGYDPSGGGVPVGVYAGAGISTYLLFGLLPHIDPADPVTGYQALIANDKDHLATRTAYKLNLTGPSLSVQTACSTSLVAVHLACQALSRGECGMAIAGGATITVPREQGYVYREGGIFSPDGHCRAFDAQAKGTVAGSGVGVVVLKRLDEALRDGDPVHAVIKGSAINNDGGRKVGYTAPSIGGQAEVIRMALDAAGVGAESISYVEAHGTGTPLGDPIELAALTEVFGPSADGPRCGIGSVKTNVGHLDAAAGAASLIKVALSLRNELLPASLHYTKGNPAVDWANSPFYVVDRARPWNGGSPGQPRRAGVSSFGIGGTNAHVIVEEAPAQRASDAAAAEEVLVLSARTPSALQAMRERLAAHLEAEPLAKLSDVAFTLQQGRKAFGHRWSAVCGSAEQALNALRGEDARAVRTGLADAGERPVVFAFPGQGSQYVGMGAQLYAQEPVYRETVDHCAELLIPHLGMDVRDALLGREGFEAERLEETWLTQPALFVAEYALARLWISVGVKPAALIGHSLGEYTAACIAGVFSLEEGLELVSVRGRLMHRCEAGAMAAVGANAKDLTEQLKGTLEIAAVNGPKMSVVTGASEEVEELMARLQSAGVECRRLRTGGAFHSSRMEPALGELEAALQRIKLSAPQVPYVSNESGDWITAEQAESAAYWVSHARHTVKFAENAERVLERYPNAAVIEVGPGRTLTSLMRQSVRWGAEHRGVRTLPPGGTGAGERRQWLESVAELWSGGQSIAWKALHGSRVRNRVELPTYPFERQRYWIEPRLTAFSSGAASSRHALHGAVEEVATAGAVKTESAAEAVEQLYPRPQLATPYKPPENALEERLAGIWQKLLGVEQIGTLDDFFDLGGHSLLIVQMAAEVKQSLGVDIQSPRFFEHPCVAHLASLVEEHQAVAEEKTIVNALELEDPADLLERMDSMSDEEIDALLKQMEAEPRKGTSVFDTE